MNYTPEDLNQGYRIREESRETPTTFATNEGASQHVAPDKENFGKQRMAGQKLSRQQQLMSDPQEQMRTQNWMQKFDISNEGLQFNQARMMLANPQPQQPQEEQK
tara:strand:- start:5984 stop:6298 length:315 start_codon:yes stop_codon:yes gene_type:complete